MGKTRKDSRGYELKTHEYQKPDGTYMYAYYDRDRKRRFISADTLFELRKQKDKLKVQTSCRIDPAAVDKTTLNQLFDMYISQAEHLAPQTRFNYKDMYDRHVRPKFGKMKITEVRYSDVKRFYNEFLKKEKVREGQKNEKRSKHSLENIHTPLHCAFEVAVKDGLLDRNPCKDALRDYKKTREWKLEVKKREALTMEEQNAFMNYLKSNSKYESWLPIMTVLFGTGMRIGECLALRWSQVDLNKGMIYVSNSLSDRRQFDSEHAEKHNGLTKTPSSIREIPMFLDVREALQQEYEMQSIFGFCEEEIDGYTGFIFMNRDGKVLSQASVNRFIKRAYEAYNKEETVKAKEEGRNPVLIPHFSCHITRHSFCTRCIDNGIPPHIVQRIMGHSSIQTTIDIYTSVTGKQLQGYENYRLFDEDFSERKIVLSA